MGFTLSCLNLVLLVSAAFCSIIRRDATEDKAIVEGCGAKPADIVFILDESGSIYPDQWSLQKQFVANVIDLFKLGPEAIQVGVITFGTGTKPNIVLGFANDKEDLKTQVSNLLQAGGGTKTFKALELYRTYMLRHYARTGVDQVAIVITDGESEDEVETGRQAKLLHDMDVSVIAVGVGQEVDSTELHKIASEPGLVFEAKDFQALEMLKNMLAWKACAPPTTTTTTTPTTTTTLPQMIEGCSGHLPIDVIFSIPDQAGINHNEKALDFVGSVITNMTLSPYQVRVGLSPKHCYPPNQPIGLRQHDSVVGFRKGLNKRKLNGGAHTETQIEYMRTEGFSTDSGARAKSAKVGVLIVDNKSVDLATTKLEAKMAKQQCIQLVVIGVGEFVNKNEVKALAYNDQSYFFVKGYGALQKNKLNEKIEHRICEGIKYAYGCVPEMGSTS